MGDITVHMEDKESIKLRKLLGGFFENFSYVTILAICFFSGKVLAGDWIFSPRIELNELYDSNVRLEKEGLENSDYITQVNPGFNFTGTGRRTSLELDYKMQNNFYQYNGGSDSTYHNLSLNSNSEIFEDRFFLNANARYSQRNINDEKAASLDNTSIDGNRSDVSEYTIHPYIIYPFGQTAKLNIGYSTQEVDNKSDELAGADYKTNYGSVKLTSGASFSEFKWGISSSERTTEYQDREDVKYKDSKLDIKWLISGKFYMIGVLGKEKYNYKTLADQEKPEGNYWETGIGWRPSVRTLIEIRKGEHYFGDTKNVFLSQKGRRFTLSATYTESVSTTSRPGIDEELINALDSDLSNLDEPLIYSNFAAVSFNKSYNISISKSTAKTEFVVRYVKNERMFLDLPITEEVEMVNLNWDWRISRYTNLVLSSTLSKTKNSDTDNLSTLKRGELRLKYKHSKSTSSYIGFNQDSQKTDTDGILYEKTVYKLGIETRF